LRDIPDEKLWASRVSSEVNKEVKEEAIRDIPDERLAATL